MKYKVKEVTHSESGRVATVHPFNQTDLGYSWDTIRLNVPVEAPCEPGDLINIEITWED